VKREDFFNICSYQNPEDAKNYAKKSASTRVVEKFFLESIFPSIVPNTGRTDIESGKELNPKM